MLTLKATRRVQDSLTVDYDNDGRVCLEFDIGGDDGTERIVFFTLSSKALRRLVRELQECLAVEERIAKQDAALARGEESEEDR